MNPRERVLCAINHIQPDRTPTDFQATYEVWNELRNHFKTTDDEKILEALEIDCRWVAPKYIGKPPKVYSDGSYEGWGGSILQKVKNKFGSYDEVVKYAVDEADTPEEIDRLLKLPALEDYDFNAVTEACKKYDDRFLLAGNASTFFFPTLVRSMENILVDMAVAPEIAQHLFEKCFKWHLDFHERLLNAGKGRIDALQIADDFATQLNPLMSPEMFRTYFKSPMKAFVELGRSFGARIFLHCCGSVYKLIPDIIDCGIEILDPVQTTAANMDPRILKKEFGDRLAFHGAINTQSILPQGTPDEVRQNAKELVDILGKDGGYILTSCHSIQPDVPVGNILALYEVENR